MSFPQGLGTQSFGHIELVLNELQLSLDSNCPVVVVMRLLAYSLSSERIFSCLLLHLLPLPGPLTFSLATFLVSLELFDPISEVSVLDRAFLVS